MYCYQLSVETQSVDYYTDAYTYYPEKVHQFSGSSVWLARLDLMLFLIRLQHNTTIVYFHKISVQLSASDKEESISLGTWFFRNAYGGRNDFNWDWNVEATFFEKYGLYRAGDKDLLAIEQAHYRAISVEEVATKNIILSKQLLLFEEKYVDSLHDYAPELGVLYFFLEDYVKVFQFLIMRPMPCLQQITHHVAFKAFTAPNGDYKYMIRFREFYDDPPFLSF